MTPPSAACSAAVSFPARPAAASSARPRAAAGAGAVRASKGAVESGGNGKWWAPLMGCSGKADYLEAPAPTPAMAHDEAARRQFVGVMMEKKGRELRARMAQTESFHNAMYHSAISSRLARSS